MAGADRALNASRIPDGLVVYGLDTIQGLAERLDAKDDRIVDQQDRIEKLESENDRLREQNAALESRLERIESELGIEEKQQRVADDC